MCWAHLDCRFLGTYFVCVCLVCPVSLKLTTIARYGGRMEWINLVGDLLGGGADLEVEILQGGLFWFRYCFSLLAVSAVYAYWILSGLDAHCQVAWRGGITYILHHRKVFKLQLHLFHVIYCPSRPDAINFPVGTLSSKQTNSCFFFYFDPDGQVNQHHDVDRNIFPIYNDINLGNIKTLT